MSIKIDVYDNVLEDHVFEMISAEVDQVKWHWHSYSNKNYPTKHWVARCGESPEQVEENGYGWVLPIWDTAFNKYNFKEKYGIAGFKRIYMNGHTHGMEPHWHRDDGDFTMIYYPNKDWKLKDDGGTFIFGEELDYEKDTDSFHGHPPKDVERYNANIPNRLLVFNAHLWHKAAPVSRQCYDLRSCIVFKCVSESGGDVDRLDFYKQ